MDAFFTGVDILDTRLSGEDVATVVNRYVWRLGYGMEDFAQATLKAALATSAAQPANPSEPL